MNSPWQILGLDRDSATKKDVKAAYARLIKVHRPEDDPEGFQRVRQAYESALAMIESGVKEELAPEAAAGPAQPFEAPEVESLPPALIEAELEIHRARQAGDQAGLEKAVRGLQPLCLGLRPGRAGWRLWLGAMHRATEGKSSLVAACLPVSQLINELESGTCNITHVVITYWEESGDSDRLVALAQSLLADKARLQNREAGMAALRLGIVTGFLKPALASALGSFAFPHVDREAREALLPKVEEQAAIGNLMIGLRLDQRHFWHQRVRQPGSGWDWTSKEAEDALNYLVREKGPHWSGYGIVKQIVPADWFLRLEKEMGRVRGGLAGRIKPPSLGNPRPVRTNTGGGGRGPWGYVWVVFLVLSSLARLVNDNSASYHRYESSPGPASKPWQPYLESRRLVEPSQRNTAFQPVPASRPPALEVSSSPLSPYQIDPQADIFHSAYHSPYKAAATPAASSGAAPPASTGTATQMPYRTKKAKEKAEGLRHAGRSLDTWLEAANQLEKQATDAWVGKPAEQQRELRTAFRVNLYKLMSQVHTTSTDPAYEYRFLDVLLYDPDTSADQRDVAMLRMAEIEAADVFLPKWEEAASLVNPIAAQVAARSAWYLEHKSGSLLPDLRKRFELLARQGT